MSLVLKSWLWPLIRTGTEATDLEEMIIRTFDKMILSTRSAFDVICISASKSSQSERISLRRARFNIAFSDSSIFIPMRNLTRRLLTTCAWREICAIRGPALVKPGMNRSKLTYFEHEWVTKPMPRTVIVTPEFSIVAFGKTRVKYARSMRDMMQPESTHKSSVLTVEERRLWRYKSARNERLTLESCLI
jgi:hypothetical protein